MANSISAKEQRQMHKDSKFMKLLDIRMSAMEKSWTISEKLNSSMEKIGNLYNNKLT
jgi:hypothetical protein